MASKPVVRQRGRRTSGAKRRAWLPWAIGGAVLVAVIAGFVIMRVTNTTSAAPDAGVAAVARTNAGTEVKVYTGTHHTVYHSTAPLPSETNPRADGKPTLVWFSGTYCEYCEQMEPFAHRTAA